MSQVSVDPDKIREATKQIRSYIEVHERSMDSIDTNVSGMRAEEVGAEFDLLQEKWAQAKGNGSTSQKMILMLNSYARYLDLCAQSYEIAQSNAQYYAYRI